MTTRKTKKSAPAKVDLALLTKKAGFAAALPSLLLSIKGEILETNARMNALLGEKREWPFFNEEDSKMALFKRVCRSDRDELFQGEAGLKTYRIHVRQAGPSRRLVVAELVRSGDLLKDGDARQTLFRSLSHEIRTSTLALRGYLDMLADKNADREVLARMVATVDRLDRVVDRLADFRAVLGDTK